jgi:serine/threonine-protein kinase ULK2
MSASPRRQQLITAWNGLGLDVDGIRDPVEDQLLENLEELAQKTDVLGHWADEMYEYVKSVPQSMLNPRYIQT